MVKFNPEKIAIKSFRLYKSRKLKEINSKFANKIIDKFEDFYICAYLNGIKDYQNILLKKEAGK